MKTVKLYGSLVREDGWRKTVDVQLEVTDEAFEEWCVAATASDRPITTFIRMGELQQP